MKKMTTKEIVAEDILKASQSMFFVERDIQEAHAKTENVAEEMVLLDLLTQAIKLKTTLERLAKGKE